MLCHSVITMHRHNNIQSPGNRLKLGIIISVIIFSAEIIGGIISNSLALLSDAGHVFTDIVALSLSAYALHQAARPPDNRMTFGYHRLGVIIAVINALAIFGIAGFIIYESLQRFQSPPEVNSPVMLLVAVLGLLANLVVAFWLRQAQKDSINIKSAFWHVLGDALASVGVIAGALIIMFTGFNAVDIIISALIAVIIAVAAWNIFAEAVKVLLESAPGHIDLKELANSMTNIPGVDDTHDLHVWSLTPQLHALSAHIVISDRLTSQSTAIRTKVESLLAKKYHITHTTLQIECRSCASDTASCPLAKELRSPSAIDDNTDVTGS